MTLYEWAEDLIWHQPKDAVQLLYDLLIQNEHDTRIVGRYPNMPNSFYRFMTETDFAWDLLPYTFLYDLYKRWLDRNMPDSKAPGYQTFIAICRIFAKNSTIWSDNQGSQVHSVNRMNRAEPLLEEYDMIGSWGRPDESNPNRRIRPYITKGQNYHGLVRRSSQHRNTKHNPPIEKRT